MNGCLAKPRVASEIRNHSTFAEEESLSNGINITLNIIAKMTLHRKQSKDINSTSSIPNYMTNKKHHNIISKRPKVQIFVWSNSKLALPIKISDLKSREDNGISQKNQVLKVSSIKESCNCISTLKNQSSEFDIC